MPFKSEKQRKYLWANEPEIARDWTDTYGSKIHKADGGAIAGGNQIGERRGNRTGFRNPHEATAQAGGKKGYSGGTHGSYGGGGGHHPHPGFRSTYIPPKPKHTPGSPPDRFRGGGIRNINPYINVNKPKAWNEGYGYQTHWKNFLPGGKPFRTYGPLDEKDETITITDTVTDTVPENPSLGTHLLHPKATERQEEKKTAWDTFYKENPDMLPNKAQGGIIGSVGGISRPKYQQGNMVGAEMEGAEMEGAMMQSQEVIKELYDALIAQGLSPQEAMEKIKEIIASTQTQEPESPMMAEEFPGQEFSRTPAAFGGIMDTYTGRRKYKLGSLKKKLEKYAPEGESLAFINKEEADLLKSRGGYGRPVNESGIPSFGPFDAVSSFFEAAASPVKKVVEKVKKLASSKFGKLALMYAAGTYLGGTQAFGGTGQLSFAQRLKDPKLLANLINPTGSGVGEGKGWSLFQKAPVSDFEVSGRALKGTGQLGNTFARVMSEGEKLATLPEGLKKLALDAGTVGSKTLMDKIPGGALTAIGLPSLAAGAYTAAQPPEELGGEVTAEYDDNKAWWDNYLANLDSDYSVNPARLAAEGGRIGYANGGDWQPDWDDVIDPSEPPEHDIDADWDDYLDVKKKKKKKKKRAKAQEGGLMNLGGMEKDYRNDGGFVPIGGEEKADDVPARLSRNEFVFTADAVRNAGGGDIDRGAEVMENVMKNLEAGGKVSEESQGKQGAQEMFEVSERLSEVV